MADFDKKSLISITCSKHLEEMLMDEVEELGYSIELKRTAGIEIEGSLFDCMRLNLMLGLAHRINYLVTEFEARTDKDLYDKVKAIPWEQYISPTGYVTVTSRVEQKGIDNTQFANLRCKDGIVDRIKQRKGARPNSGPRLDGTVVFLFWRHNKVRIFLDTSGESLSRRGYRTNNASAPMQETLARGIVKRSGWDETTPFVNPMCGSGTIAIEAALLALKKPPGILRPHFAFKKILGFDEKAWQRLRATLKSTKPINPLIIATDNDPRAIKAARKNAITAGVDKYIQFEVCDFRQTSLPNQKGTIVINPPYGERLGDTSSLENFYKAIGDYLKKSTAGFRSFIFTGNMSLAKKIGLRSSSKTPFYNSTIECRLLEYEVY